MSNRLSSVKTQPGCACTALLATLFALGSTLHRFCTPRRRRRHNVFCLGEPAESWIAPKT